MYTGFNYNSKFVATADMAGLVQVWRPVCLDVRVC